MKTQLRMVIALAVMACCLARPEVTKRNATDSASANDTSIDNSVYKPSLGVYIYSNPDSDYVSGDIDYSSPYDSSINEHSVYKPSLGINIYSNPGSDCGSDGSDYSSYYGTSINEHSVYKPNLGTYFYTDPGHDYENYGPHYLDDVPFGLRTFVMGLLNCVRGFVMEHGPMAYIHDPHPYDVHDSYHNIFNSYGPSYHHSDYSGHGSFDSYSFH